MKTPYYFQEEAIQSVWDYYESGKTGNCIIALPTGTGKSLVISEIVRRATQMYRGHRTVMLTHVHTLISQNYTDLLEQWPSAPAGICSAGLKQLETELPIVYGGVQTVVKRTPGLGHRDLLIIDECHLLSPKAETSYQKVIRSLQIINPNLRVIGLSATVYRLGQGLLTEDGIFTDIVCNYTSLEKFNKLLGEGYLAPPIPMPTKTEFDLRDVHIIAGEYNQAELALATNQRDINLACCKEICEMAYKRRSWLVFCTDIDHAENITLILRHYGVDVDVVHSKKSPDHNRQTIQAWKDGRLRCIVNKDMLTTGVNHRGCDFIAMLRATVSPSLWVQMLGRGTRTAEGKSNCLVADFAGNTKRLGPINDPVLPRKPGKGGNPGTPPIRICPNCSAYNHASARKCQLCGMDFPVNSKLTAKPSTDELVRTVEPQIEKFDVHHVLYKPHIKDGKASLRVSYHCGNLGLMRYDEYVCFEHSGFPRKQAKEWWKLRSDMDTPINTDHAIEMSSMLRVPRSVSVWVNRTFPEITEVEF